MTRFRPLRPDDFPMLLDWLRQPQIARWWGRGDDTLEKVAQRYSSEPETIKRFIMQVAGGDSGYAEYRRLDDGHCAMDLFLAGEDPSWPSVERRFLWYFTKFIRKKQLPDVITAGPHPDHKRAIECYESCDFVNDPSRSTAEVHFMLKRYGVGVKWPVKIGS